MWRYHRKVSPEPTRILIRHADADDRRLWTGADDLRELTVLGRHQAAALAATIVGMPIVRVLSSPAVRCQQTVEPLARLRGLPVELCPLLGLDADPAELADLLCAPHTDNFVVCTHGETLVALIHELFPDNPYQVTGALLPTRTVGAWTIHTAADGARRLRRIRILDAVEVRQQGLSLPDVSRNVDH